MALTTQQPADSLPNRDVDPPPPVTDDGPTWEPTTWTNRSHALRVTLLPGDLTCTVCLQGLLDESALQPCRAALDAAIEHHPGRILLDLTAAQARSPVGLVLLAAARRYCAHRGVAMTLAGVSEALRQAIVDAGLTRLVRP